MITEKQCTLIGPYMPVQRGNVQVSNLTVINAILFVSENGRKWRDLPLRYGNCHRVFCINTPVDDFAAPTKNRCLAYLTREQKNVQVEANGKPFRKEWCAH